MFLQIGQKEVKLNLVKINQRTFGITQGGLYKDLRIESIEKLIEIDFNGYAMGGLAVSEKQSDMFKILNETTKFLPKNKPRYLMGEPPQIY